MVRFTWVVAALLLVGSTRGFTQDRSATVSAVLPPPRFADPARRASLERGFPELDRLFSAFASERHIPGAAWGVIVDGELVHTGAAGVREVASSAPVSDRTVFRIASMTKSFTAVAILQLRDAGKLSLDDPAVRYVPELKSVALPTADSPPITIRHLLSHSEGFPEDNPWGDRQLAISDGTMDALMRRGIPFSNAPGVAYEYSNYGFALLGRIVANVSGESYAGYVQRHILEPLGMQQTMLEPSAVPADQLAHGYKWNGSRWLEEPQLAHGAFGAMGGLLTSTRDLAKYVAMFLDAWPPRDDRERWPLSRASLREMQQLWRAAPARVSRDEGGRLQLDAGGYGYGLRISQTCEIGHVVAHGGGLPGFGSYMAWLPEHGVGVITLGNVTYAGWGRIVSRAFQSLAATGGLQPRVPQPSPALSEIRGAVSRLINDWSDERARAIAADNLFLDEPLGSRREQIQALRARLGTCAPDGRFEVENALRGSWKMTCERGALVVSLTLAPVVPPGVQYLSVRELTDEWPVPASACAQ